MADNVIIKHAYITNEPADPDPTMIDGPKWDAAEILSGGTAGQTIARDPTSATGAIWVPFASFTPVTDYALIPIGEWRVFVGGSPRKLALVYNDNGTFLEMSVTA